MAKNFWETDAYEQNSLRGRIFNRLQQDIINGKYHPGEGLVETKLAEELGVSRTPVREALRQLELEGLVVYVPNKGVFVTEITEQDIEDIYTIRSTMEGLAVRWGVSRISLNQLKELEEIVSLMEHATGKNDMERLTELDTRFHETIYDASNSKVLKHTLRSLLRYIERARLGSYKVPKRAERALEEHKAILEAFKKGDAKSGELLMINHISQASQNLHTHKDILKDI